MFNVGPEVNQGEEYKKRNESNPRRYAKRQIRTMCVETNYMAMQKARATKHRPKAQGKGL